jgi:hypothetical protein
MKQQGPQRPYNPGVDPVKRDAERYRLAQARQLERCYELAEGHPAPSTEAVLAWYETNRDNVPYNERGKIEPLY